MRKISWLLIFFIPYTSQAETSFHQKGLASWYGNENKVSCTGKRLNNNLPAAAHRHLPIGTKIKVTSVKTKKTIIVSIQDRGPYTKKRIIDLNFLAARRLGIIKKGVEEVILERV